MFHQFLGKNCFNRKFLSIYQQTVTVTPLSRDGHVTVTSRLHDRNLIFDRNVIYHIFSDFRLKKYTMGKELLVFIAVNFVMKEWQSWPSNVSCETFTLTVTIIVALTVTILNFYSSSGGKFPFFHPLKSFWQLKKVVHNHHNHNHMAMTTVKHCFIKIKDHEKKKYVKTTLY